MFDVVRRRTVRTSDGKNIEQKYLMELTWFITKLTGVKTISHTAAQTKVDFLNTKHEIQLTERIFKVC